MGAAPLDAQENRSLSHRALLGAVLRDGRRISAPRTEPLAGSGDVGSGGAGGFEAMEALRLLFRVLGSLHATVMLDIVTADDLAHKPLGRDPGPLVRSLGFELRGRGISALSCCRAAGFAASAAVLRQRSAWLGGNETMTPSVSCWA